MSDMLSKEHYCYKIYKSIINKKQCLPPSPPLQQIFTRKSWSSLSMTFQKSQPPINEGVHSMNTINSANCLEGLQGLQTFATTNSKMFPKQVPV